MAMTRQRQQPSGRSNSERNVARSRPLAGSKSTQWRMACLVASGKFGTIVMSGVDDVKNDGGR